LSRCGPLEGAHGFSRTGGTHEVVSRRRHASGHRARNAGPGGRSGSKGNRRPDRKALAEVGCKPTEIERDDKGYNLDDAECADGPNDIKLDKDFKITSRRKE
jgi:hypothetical protein